MKLGAGGNQHTRGDSGTASSIGHRRAAGLVEPCRADTRPRPPPSGPDWLHKIKHDGFRILARRDAKGVRLYTRNATISQIGFALVAASCTVPQFAMPLFYRMVDEPRERESR
jgi:hypothetical protein